MSGSSDTHDPTGLDDVERRLRAIRDNPEKSTTLRALAQYQLERIAALRAEGPAATVDGAPTVTVERLGPFRFSAIPGTTIVGIEIDRGGSVPLVTVVSGDEIRLLMPLFVHIRAHLDRDEPIRIDIREAFLNLIGHDPFHDQV
ncbi:hypothetical protein [Plantactinospora sp. B5E13]|uniref:hypothetical protein n=1 Tax=unclassified Plantactinospora TaxID=2631981 RepID=UPI00325CCB61